MTNDNKYELKSKLNIDIENSLPTIDHSRLTIPHS